MNELFAEAMNLLAVIEAAHVGSAADDAGGRELMQTVLFHAAQRSAVLADLAEGESGLTRMGFGLYDLAEAHKLDAATPVTA